MRKNVEVGSRVVVEPRSPYCAKEEKARLMRTLSEAIASQIERHVDNVSSIAVESIEESRCSHCGSVWTETSPLYNGGCCQEDQLCHENDLHHVS